MTTRCKAFTRSGERCRNQVRDGADYCSKHEQNFCEVEGFLKQHKDHVIGFMLGLLTETIVDDAYEEIKAKLFRRAPPSDTITAVQKALALVAKALPVFHFDSYVFNVAFLAGSESPPFPLLECHIFRSETQPPPPPEGVIGVFYIDSLGRRFIGEARGKSPRMDYQSSPPCLLTDVGRQGDNELVHCYEVQGKSGEEILVLTKEFYFIRGSSLMGSGSLGMMSWNNPKA